MKLITVSALLASVLLSKAQTFTETINKEYQFEKPAPQNTLILANINGSVKIEGYPGNKILLEVERTIKAKTQDRLEKGKQEMQLRMTDRFDTVIFYVGGGCNRFGYENKKNNYRWGYSWDCQKDCQEMYDYTFNFTVKVPDQINVDVSNINDGKITISGMKAGVKANHINGSISLTGLEGPTEATTINGNVDLDYTKNPTGNCHYYSLNGDINALFQKGLGATMSFKSFNGELYTNLENLQSLPMEVEKIESENGIRLKVGGSKYKIRQGGALLDFETFNGDAIVKEK